MNKEVKKIWLEALRSGEYKQGTGCLRSNDKFCCLGVLTDLYAKEYSIRWAAGIIQYFDGEELVLPDIVQEWSGINRQVPIVNITKDEADKVQMDYTLCNETGVTQLNDHGLDFKQLADIIEREIPGE